MLINKLRAKRATILVESSRHIRVRYRFRLTSFWLQTSPPQIDTTPLLRRSRTSCRHRRGFSKPTISQARYHDSSIFPRSRAAGELPLMSQLPLHGRIAGGAAERPARAGRASQQWSPPPVTFIYHFRSARHEMAAPTCFRQLAARRLVYAR